MKEKSPRVPGFIASKREVWLWRIFKAILTVATCLVAIQGVRSVYERAAGGSGFDFYQFWLGGDVLRSHEAAGKHETLDLYTHEAHVRIGTRYVEIARTRSCRQRQAAGDRKIVDTASSPFFYWVFSVLTPGDYDREYNRYILFSVACMVAAMTAYAWRLRYSIAGTAAAIALAAFSAPVHSEYSVINFNFPELVICFIYLLLRERGRNSTRFAPAYFVVAGVVMGSLAAFKPNLLLFPFLLGVSSLISRRWHALLSEVGGFSVGVTGAVAVSSWAFGGLSCWTAWGKVVLALGSQPSMPSLFGNFSVTRNIYEITGHNFISLFLGIGTLLAIGAVWRGRAVAGSSGTHADQKMKRDDSAELHSRSESGLAPTLSRGHREDAADLEFRFELAILGLAVSVTLLSSGLAWVHYPILLFPFLLLAASPSLRRIAIACNVARFLLVSIVIALLLFPPPEEIQRMLGLSIAGDIRSWIHCTQAAVVITFMLALWFGASVVGRMGL